MQGAGSKPRLGKAGGSRVPARELCEDFAPRNGAARVRGERGANRTSKKPAGPEWRRGNCVKILLPGTELQGFAGSGEQTAPRKSRPASSGHQIKRAWIPPVLGIHAFYLLFLALSQMVLVKNKSNTYRVAVTLLDILFSVLSSRYVIRLEIRDDVKM